MWCCGYHIWPLSLGEIYFMESVILSMQMFRDNLMFMLNYGIVSWEGQIELCIIWYHETFHGDWDIPRHLLYVDAVLQLQWSRVEGTENYRDHHYSAALLPPQIFSCVKVKVAVFSLVCMDIVHKHPNTLFSTCNSKWLMCLSLGPTLWVLKKKTQIVSPPKNFLAN